MYTLYPAFDSLSVGISHLNLAKLIFQINFHHRKLPIQVQYGYSALEYFSSAHILLQFQFFMPTNEYSYKHFPFRKV